ncbi:MAG: hypothetical protein N2517_07350 [Ignavibacteria bacterium]|nr:hypothetical protein [Ignavibacteria bacterium]
MIQEVKTSIKYNHTFDPRTKRHYINGFQAVLHCHHYSTLYTQLALDASETELLKDCARDSFREVLDNYFVQNPDISTIQDKINIAIQYFSLFGLGKMKVNFLGDFSGEVELITSHIDSGWLKKWGTYDKPVNYISAGYIEAMFESVLGVSSGTFKAVEVQSIVMGSKSSLFKITRR